MPLLSVCHQALLFSNILSLLRKGSWAGPSSTCPTGMPSLPRCPTSELNTGERRPGSVPAETRPSCGSMRLSSTLTSSPPRKSSPANTSSGWCPPSCPSHLRLSVCSSTKWTAAAEPSMTLSRRTCRASAFAWIQFMTSYGGMFQDHYFYL